MSKTHVKAHKRRVKSGKVVPVREHTRENEWQSETGFDSEFLNAFEEEHGKIKRTYDGDNRLHGRGIGVETEDGEEWLIFDNETDARFSAEDEVKEMIEEEPESFDQDWIHNFVFVSKVDAQMMASEEASNLSSDMTPEDLMEEAGMLDEFNNETDEEKKSEIVRKATDKFEREVYDRWVDGLEDNPVEFLCEDEGIYSEEELYKQSFIQIDSDKASKGAIATDGVAHFLSSYDGEEVELKGKYMYRTN